MKFKDYYETMGLERTASQEEIKRAYRRLARKYHPDVSKESDASERFKEMKEAYEVLKDPEKRKAYDRFGENWKAGQDFQPPPDWGREFSFGQGGFDSSADYSDFFETLFGAGARRADSFGGAPRGARFRDFRDTRMDGEDVNARISIPLEEAYRGTTRQLAIEVPEVDSSGRMMHKRRTLNVSIPKGIKAGQRIRLEGQGGRGMGREARPGDLYLLVDLEPHPLYSAEGRDIKLSLPVTPAEAALGRTVKTPTLGGPVDLKIPPGSNTGKRLRLKGRGLPGDPPGDQFVELKIVLPDEIGEAARKLYEQLEKADDFDPRRHMER